MGKPGVQLTATAVEYLPCARSCVLHTFNLLEGPNPHPKPPVLVGVWGSTETHMTLTFTLPVPRHTSLGSSWQWQGKQPGQSLNPALGSRAIKWVCSTPPHLSVWPLACCHPRLCLWTEVLRVNEGRGIQRPSKKIRKQEIGEIKELMSAWEVITRQYSAFVPTCPGTVTLLHFTEEETETQRGCDIRGHEGSAELGFKD